jgi:hypothetical protein
MGGKSYDFAPGSIWGLNPKKENEKLGLSTRGYWCLELILMAKEFP